MKFLKPLIVVVLAMTLLPAFTDKDKAKRKAKKAVENCCGRCTGSSSCRVCSNCSRCAHCNSGGSCGVCRTGNRSESEPSNTYTPSKTYTPSSRSTNYSTEEAGNTTRFVTAKQLNIREEPSTTAKIVGVLYQNDQVTVLETLSTGWVKINTVSAGGTELVGYVMGKYLNQ